MLNTILVRAFLVGVLLPMAGATPAKDNGTTRHQTLPGTSIRDYSAPSYVTKGNVTYQTLPGTSIRDYGAPSYVTKGHTTYKTLPGSTIRDYRAPTYVIEK